MKTHELIARLNLEDPDKDHFVNNLGGAVVQFEDMKSSSFPDVSVLTDNKYGTNDILKLTRRIPRYNIRVYSKGLMVEGHLEFNTNSNRFYITHIRGDRRTLHCLSNCKCAFSASDVTKIDYDSNSIFL